MPRIIYDRVPAAVAAVDDAVAAAIDSATSATSTSDDELFTELTLTIRKIINAFYIQGIDLNDDTLLGE